MDNRAEKGKPLIDPASAARQSLRTGAHASTGFGIVSARSVALRETAGKSGGSGDAGPGTVFSDGHGKVLDNVHVQLIFWGKSWATIDFDLGVEDVVNAVITLLDSPYMSALQQYRVTGTGTLVGSILVTDSDPPALFEDTDVSNQVAALVSSGALPEPADDPQLLYCVILPAGVTSAANSSFVGEHFSFSLNGSPGQIAWVTTNDRTIGALSSLTRTSRMNWSNPVPTPSLMPFRVFRGHAPSQGPARLATCARARALWAVFWSSRTGPRRTSTVSCRKGW
jgi:hypothetical protein